MAVIKNPKKVFNFRMVIPTLTALPVFSVQSVTLPDVEIEADEHGHGNAVVKTAGLTKLGTLVVNRIIPLKANDINLGDPFSASTINTIFYNWSKAANDPIMGIGQPEGSYKHTIIIHEISNDGFSIVGTFILYGCWPTKISGREFKRGESGNLIESIEFAVDYMHALK